MRKLTWKECNKKEKSLRVIGYVIFTLMLIATAFVVFG